MLYALVAAAYAAGTGHEPAIPDGLMLDAPEQARIDLRAGEPYAFGWTLLAPDGAAAARTTGAVLRGLVALGHKKLPNAKVLGGNFVLRSVEDLVKGEEIRPGASGTPDLMCIPGAHLRREFERVDTPRRLALRFTSPLRIERGDAFKQDGRRYFDSQHFDSARFVQRVRHRLAGLNLWPRPEDDWPHEAALLENRLVWLDLAYGGAKGKTLGGAVGRVVLDCPRIDIIAALVMGQYARVGLNTRFGFGAYRIEELGPEPFACARARPLLAAAMASHELQRAADELDLPSGSTRRLAEQVLRGDYEPGPHARVGIARHATPATGPGEKAEGTQTGEGKAHARTPSVRVLSIPSRADRALQRAVLSVLAPALDGFFEQSSLAYRKGLGRTRAAMRVRDAVGRGYQFALRADFSRFFDSIPHDRLADRLEAYLADTHAAGLLMKWVRAGSPFDGRGLPTGSPLSPLLANLFLDGFDEEVERGGAALVRYADDFLILYKNGEDADAVYQAAADAAASLALTLNESKTHHVSIDAPFEFLGFRFERRDRWECTPSDRPHPVDQLGWRQASNKPLPDTPAATLPGEGTVAAPSARSFAVVGPGVTSVRCDGQTLTCAYKGGGGTTTAPIDSLREIIILGAPSIDRGLIHAAASETIRIIVCDASGAEPVVIAPDECFEDAQAVTALAMASRDTTFRLGIARRLIAAKISNYASLADADPGGFPSGPGLAVVPPDTRTGEELRALAVKARNAPTRETLLGIEGAAAAKWYGRLHVRLPSWCNFTRRVAPDAADPVNVLLNMAQTALHRQLVLAIRLAGLVPSIGLLHEPRPGHNALASDLQEPFRHLMDRAAIHAARTLQPKDFRADPQGRHRLSLSSNAVRHAVAVIHRTFAIAATDAGHREAHSYLTHFSLCARGLRRSLLDRSQPFIPFQHEDGA